MIESLYAPPSADIASTATLSWTTGSPNALYPVVNAKSEDPEEVAKANETTVQLTAVLPGSTQLVGVAAIHTNWAGKVATLSNTAGLSVPITVVDPEDELGINALWDVEGLPNTTSNTWRINVSGLATPAALGRLMLITTWVPLQMEWKFKEYETHPNLEHRTGNAKRHVYGTATKYRGWEGTTIKTEDHENLTSLRRETRGTLTPFLLVMDAAEPTGALVQFSNNRVEAVFEFYRGRFSNNTAIGKVSRSFDVEEVSAGVPL